MLLPVVATVREASALLASVMAGVDDDTVVDCSQCERCDAAGLQVLVALRNELADRGRRFQLVAVPSAIRWRFELVGLETAITGDPVPSSEGSVLYE